MEKSKENIKEEEKSIIKKTEEKDERYRLYATLSFMAVVFGIGLPMWWKTTEVYRVSLPSSEILAISETILKNSMKIGIFTFNPERSEMLIRELHDAYKEDVFWDIQFEQIKNIEHANAAKTPAALEKAILQKYHLGPGEFLFIEWPKLTDQILIECGRSALFKSDTSSFKIKNVLDVGILQTKKIHSILNEDKRYASKTSVPQPQYDVVVSVLNPRPDIMNVKWNVQLATETYIAPFLKEVNQISNFTLRTQWKYQVPFDFQLQQIRDQSKIGRYYALPEATLPHIITSFEKNLGVGITDNSAINLVVYVPPCDIAPLHIYNRNEQVATKNKVDSFISPKWGGIIIHNPSEEVCLVYNQNLQKVNFIVNTNDVMQIMLYHLHKLLDIHVHIAIKGVSVVDIGTISPRKWEYEAYIRRSIVSHIVTSTNTLQSLIQLLDTINYIVINDNVGEAVKSSYENILLAKKFLKKNDIFNASVYAKNAYIFSEQAFFDSSLLAQLYFPDEQKYAIYIPLFLPIMVPVISSVSMIKKYFSSKVKTD